MIHAEVVMEDVNTRTRPPKPEAPLDSDCCGNGCSLCVFDLYQEELEVWERECRGISEGKTADSGTPVTAALSETEYRAFPVSSIEKEGAHSCIFRLDLPPGHCLGVDVGQHVVVRMFEGQTAITRQYTPVSPPRTPGHFELLIKIYPDGRMSKLLSEIRPGDSLFVRGPGGDFSYVPNQWQCVYLLAAGTGIAPMAQVIQQVLSNEGDDTRLCLLYTCARYEELLLKERLDEWAGFWNMSITFFLTQDSESRVSGVKRYGEKIEYGRIQPKHLSSVLVNRPPRFQILICGTPQFDRDMISYLSRMSISCDNYHKF